MQINCVLSEVSSNPEKLSGRTVLERNAAEWVSARSVLGFSWPAGRTWTSAAALMRNRHRVRRTNDRCVDTESACHVGT
jgi:hypothetical protein